VSKTSIRSVLSRHASYNWRVRRSAPARACRRRDRCDGGTARYLTEVAEDLKACGFIADALRRSGRDAALVAPPGPAGAAGVRRAGTG